MRLDLQEKTRVVSAWQFPQREIPTQSCLCPTNQRFKKSGEPSRGLYSLETTTKWRESVRPSAALSASIRVKNRELPFLLRRIYFCAERNNITRWDDTFSGYCKKGAWWKRIKYFKRSVIEAVANKNKVRTDIMQCDGMEVLTFYLARWCTFILRNLMKRVLR